MDGARWSRIQDLFHRAADLPFPQQASFLRQACGDDRALEAEVRAMLDEDGRGDSLLEGGVAHLAERVLAERTPPLSATVDRLGPYRVVGVIGEGGMGGRLSRRARGSGKLRRHQGPARCLALTRA